ncbi:MAG: VanZ family protein, partial [Methanosarcinales archaeon]
SLGCFTNRNKVKIILLVIIVCSLYGIADEIHQHFVPGRDCSGLDMIANFAGSLLGVSINLKFYKKRFEI